jgi:hypothetical protein
MLNWLFRAVTLPLLEIQYITLAKTTRQTTKNSMMIINA